MHSDQASGLLRVPDIDVMRGFALLGIFFVNILTFNGTVTEALNGIFVHHTALGAGLADIVLALAAAKFYPIFSMLFGFGAVRFFESAHRRGLPARRLFARRLALLAAFGLLHGALVWWCDILFVYGVLGFLVVPFLARSARAVGVAALLAFIAPAAILATVPVNHAEFSPLVLEPQIAEEVALYGTGTFSTIARARTGDQFRYLLTGLTEPIAAPAVFAESWLYYFHVVALFLVGLWFAKARFFESLAQKGARCSLRYAAIAAAVAFVATLPLSGVVGAIMSWHFNPLVAFVYLCLLSAALRTRSGAALLGSLAAIGAMSLSNYLAQTVFMSFLFYGYGLGYLHQLDPTMLLPTAFAFYVLQVLGSAWWRHRFGQGPVERVWRWLTFAGIGRTAPTLVTLKE